MTVSQSLLAFTLAATLLAITPGIDTALVLRTAAARGARQAMFAALGIALGCLAWGAAASLGLGALLAASNTAFTVVKWLGAAYLLWLGVKLLMKPRASLNAAEGIVVDAQESNLQALSRGLLANILNPKVGVFYVTFLPQFIPLGSHLASFSFLLACIHVVLTLIWFAMLIAATVPLSRFLARGAVMKTLDRLTGAVFIVCSGLYTAHRERVRRSQLPMQAEPSPNA